ncbi:MAG: DNA translocase FtsK [Clostridia bacterium]|nr:DNA translocase FtsK [Clostridia bacterium]
MLLICALLIVARRRKKVRMQALCWAMIPLLFGAVRHVLANGPEYYPALSRFVQMGADGRRLASGGILAGGLGELLRAALSTVGATILLCLLLAVCVLGGLRLTPRRIIDGLNRLRPIPEDALPPEPEPDFRDEARQAARRQREERLWREQAAVARRPNIDVALDDEPVSRRTPDPNRKSRVAPPNVSTPAEVLRGIFHKDKQEARATAAERETAAEAPAPAEPVISEPAAAKQQETLDPKEVARETAEVSQQIEKALEKDESTPIYLYPPLRLLKAGSGKPAGSAEAIRRCAERLVDTLESFGVSATVIDTTDGPAVTRYELVLQRGIKFSKVANLADDIALALGASGIRVSTIPDKNAVGIEVPNEVQEIVTARDIIASQAFQSAKSRLAFAVGKDITGQAVVGDIAKMPHMLIAGTTGSGKSVCINSILMSLLYKATPDEVRLIMVDPKMIELGVYNGIPHLLIPVVTDPKKAAGALNWAVTEMMRRYKLFSEVGARDLKSYNAEVERNANEGGEGETLPQIVIVIDELSDLMAVARSEVEEAIIRLAQMARAAGMHLIIATQRPSADVITGLMKTNIPSRIAFAVASGIDSRIILDQLGAEKLLGKGDMLYFPLGIQKPQRVQGCFVSDREVEEVVAFVKQCGMAEYDDSIIQHIENQAKAAETTANGGGGLEDEGEDEKFDEAVEIVIESGQASTSMLQRRLKLGYSRAARLVDEMEERGIVGPYEGSKPRAVLITRQEWQERMIRKKEC